MEGTMNAVHCVGREEPWQYVEDAPIPQIKDDEVLLEIKACGICGTDHSLHRGQEALFNSYDIHFPAVFGHEFSGVIAEVGKNAPSNLKVGMRVTANPVLFDNTCSYCDKGMVNICDNHPFYGTDLPGAFAKYMPMRATNVIPLPDDVSFVQGALLEPLGVALNAVERVHPEPGDTALVMGPGPIGLLMIAVLKQAYGIQKVICSGLAMDTKRLQVAEQLGAITINGSEEDVIARVKELTNSKGPEIILDAAGHYTVVEQAVEMVAKNGKIGITGLPAQASSIHMNPIAMRQISIISSRAYERKHWRQGLALLANGLDIAPIASHVLPLKDFEKGMELIDAGEGLRVILEP